VDRGTADAEGRADLICGVASSRDAMGTSSATFDAEPGAVARAGAEAAGSRLPIRPEG
jgi:hypothetical protein